MGAVLLCRVLFTFASREESVRGEIHILISLTCHGQPRRTMDVGNRALLPKVASDAAQNESQTAVDAGEVARGPLSPWWQLRQLPKGPRRGRPPASSSRPRTGGGATNTLRRIAPNGPLSNSLQSETTPFCAGTKAVEDAPGASVRAERTPDQAWVNSQPPIAQFRAIGSSLSSSAIPDEYWSSSAARIFRRIEPRDPSRVQIAQSGASGRMAVGVGTMGRVVQTILPFKVSKRADIEAGREEASPGTVAGVGARPNAAKTGKPKRRSRQRRRANPRRNAAETGKATRKLGQEKRRRHVGDEGPPGKRPRTNVRGAWTAIEQADAVASIMRHLEEQHTLSERLSREQAWCVPIPHERKVSTARDFYQAYHDRTTLPIHTCLVCYRKRAERELRRVAWEEWQLLRPSAERRSPFTCSSCFDEASPVAVCGECERHLRRDSLSPAGRLHDRLGCEHMFPDELKGLSPIEEKLIAPNSCYGLFTRHAVSTGQRQTLRYPRHIKGHVTVFPNNVQELVTDVLPHPLLKVMDEICVSWQGPEKPTPKDLSALLSVRRRVVERALVWLKGHNPHYANIRIDTAEMDTWGQPVDGVPEAVYGRLERHEPSPWEKTRTAHVVPPAERGLDGEEPVAIEEILASLTNGLGAGEGDADGVAPDNTTDAAGDARADNAGEVVVDEVTSSGMFPLDGVPDVADAEKLRFACHAVGSAAGAARGGPSATIQISAEESSATRDGGEAFIRISRGDDFADSSEAAFFAKTFPTLLPFGVGGPKLAEEGLLSGRGPVSAATVSHREAPEGEAAAGTLVASRNLYLRAWADIVLRRHGGRFATHHVFAFLVFNMGVRSRNRRASMLSVGRKNFRNVERIVQSMTPERLAAASTELEKTGKTNDADVKELLRSISLYGHRQPMSREGRLTTRRKIQSTIVVGGVPAIWFTVSPNDITNPVKLRLAAYRTHDPRAAEELLKSLENSFRRTRLAISDPTSSAIFFHREMALFFEKYVNVGGESVFGRISHYFGAIETNERGALHVHGLLWLQGNAQLASPFGGADREDNDGYRDRIVRYVDSVFSEVRLRNSGSAGSAGVVVRDGAPRVWLTDRAGP